MVVGQTVTLTTTPALLYTVSGRRATVVLNRISGGGTGILVGGEASPADWFTMAAPGSVTIVMENGEELWAKTDQFTALLAIIVTGE